MWELDYKESWTLKNWCFWTMVLEKTLESPLDCKEIQPVNPKGSQSWVFIAGTDSEAEAPIVSPPDVKNWFWAKTLMLGKIEGRRRRGQQRMKWLDGITDSMDMNLGKVQETVLGVTKSRTRLSNWTALTEHLLCTSSILSPLHALWGLCRLQALACDWQWGEGVECRLWRSQGVGLNLESH